jgi:hypothetical protein
MSRSVKCVSILMLAFSACAVESDDDDPVSGDVAQAIGTECSGANPTVTFNGGANYTSPQTYDTASCFKAVVVDITSYAASFLGAGDVPGGTYISWADSLPTTAAACTSSWVRSDLFVWNAGWVYVGPRESHGAWVAPDPSDPFSLSGCLFTPGTSYTAADLQAGKTYRIAATARTAASSSAATRRVRVVSQAPVIIR